MKQIEQLHFLMLDEHGEVLFCDDAIFSSESLPNKQVFEWSPFVESIFPILLKGDQEFYKFEKVKTIHPFLNGIYDYTFYKNIGKNGRIEIIWVITDCSSYYDSLTKEQQIHHQKIIEQEMMKFKTQRLPFLQFF